MEDILTTDNQLEDVNLTQDTDTKDTVLPEDWEKKYKELQSNSERGVQMKIKELKETEQKKQFYEQVLDKSVECAADWQKLVTLYYENPEIANTILSKFYWWMGIEEYATNGWFLLHDEKNIEILATRRAAEMIEQQQVESKIDSFIAAMWYTDVAQFKEELSDVVTWKKVTAKNIDKYLMMTHTYLNKDEYNKLKEAEKQSALAKTQSAWSSNDEKDSKKKKWDNADWLLSYLKSMWM